MLYTTHYMEEAESLCDRLAIVDHGRIVAQGTMDELRTRIGERDVVRFTGTFAEVEVEGALAGLDSVEVVQVEDEALRLAVPSAARRLPELIGALHEGGAEIRETTVTRPNLESLFIELTGKELRE